MLKCPRRTLTLVTLSASQNFNLIVVIKRMGERERRAPFIEQSVRKRKREKKKMRVVRCEKGGGGEEEGEKENEMFSTF